MTRIRPGVVSVVIVNFRGVDDTLESVHRLREVEWPADKLEIVVVENGSGDDSAARLTAELGDLENIELVISESNGGFTGGSNLGAQHATGEFVAFLNNDAKPDARWIAEGIAEFETSPAVAAVGSKVLDWEGETVDFVGGSLSWFGSGFKEHVGQRDSEQWSAPRDILFGTGSALFVRADVFREVGGFDENLFMFYDDVDLGWRLNLLGYRVRFAPASVVYHKHHGSMASFGPYRESYLLERNALYLVYKNLGQELLGSWLPAALALTARRSVAKGGLDSESLDIRRYRPNESGAKDAEADPNASIPKESLAGLYALDRFVADLPALTVERDRIQAARVRTDGEVFRLFGDLFHADYDLPSYLQGLGDLVDAFGIKTAVPRRKVLILTGDALGQKMAGPAMRAWKIAEALSVENDVRLISWNQAARSSTEFEVGRVRLGNEREMAVHEAWADIIVFQGHAMHHFTTLKKSKKIIVADIYDPMHLESLEQGSEYGTEQWKGMVAGANDVLNEQLERADFFLCASERQRMFWLGQLAGLGRVNPATYSADKNLSSLIAVVPFGLDSTPPKHLEPAIRGVVPGIGEKDKLVLWGGGIYNWFDTLSLVRAVAQLAEKRPDLRLFFMGVKHPNPDVPEMALVGKTRELASRLGVLNKNVFFNESWVSLDERQNYLTEADAGVSTHYDHVETTFSFRTRILDYLWAGLPIVTTGGDTFGDLIGEKQLGVAVPEMDVPALAAALDTVLYDARFAKVARANVAAVREEFTWENALAPLVEFCRNPLPAADRASEYTSVGRSRAKASGKGGKKQRPGNPQEAALELHEIATTKSGLDRELSLAKHYLQTGGVRQLGSKVASRVLGAPKPPADGE